MDGRVGVGRVWDSYIPRCKQRAVVDDRAIGRYKPRRERGVPVVVHVFSAREFSTVALLRAHPVVVLWRRRRHCLEPPPVPPPTGSPAPRGMVAARGVLLGVLRGLRLIVPKAGALLVGAVRDKVAVVRVGPAAGVPAPSRCGGRWRRSQHEVIVGERGSDRPGGAVKLVRGVLFGAAAYTYCLNGMNQPEYAGSSILARISENPGNAVQQV